MSAAIRRSDQVAERPVPFGQPAQTRENNVGRVIQFIFGLVADEQAPTAGSVAVGLWRAVKVCWVMVDVAGNEGLVLDEPARGEGEQRIWDRVRIFVPR